MGREDYPLEDFVINLANVEERYANEITSMIECFHKSRIDLPARRLEDIGKCHLRTSRYLRKVLDSKKSELLNLWKICNTFSVASCEIDNAMREVRHSIRKDLKKRSSNPKPGMTRWYKTDSQAKKTYSTNGPTESYDVYKPKPWKMKFPFDFLERKDKREINVSNATTTPTIQTIPRIKMDDVLRPSSLYSTCSSSSEEPKYPSEREIDIGDKILSESRTDFKEQPVAPVRKSKLKQESSSEFDWVRRSEPSESDPSDYKPKAPYYEAYYSNENNIINVPVQAPRLQTRINIGDDESTTGSPPVFAQTHSIQIFQDRRTPST